MAGVVATMPAGRPSILVCAVREDVLYAHGYKCARLTGIIMRATPCPVGTTREEPCVHAPRSEAGGSRVPGSAGQSGKATCALLSLPRGGGARDLKMRGPRARRRTPRRTRMMVSRWRRCRVGPRTHTRRACRSRSRSTRGSLRVVRQHRAPAWALRAPIKTFSPAVFCGES